VAEGVATASGSARNPANFPSFATSSGAPPQGGPPAWFFKNCAGEKFLESAVNKSAATRSLFSGQPDDFAAHGIPPYRSASSFTIMYAVHGLFEIVRLLVHLRSCALSDDAHRLKIPQVRPTKTDRFRILFAMLIFEVLRFTCTQSRNFRAHTTVTTAWGCTVVAQHPAGRFVVYFYTGNKSVSSRRYSRASAIGEIAMRGAERGGGTDVAKDGGVEFLRQGFAR